MIETAVIAGALTCVAILLLAAKIPLGWRFMLTYSALVDIAATVLAALFFMRSSAFAAVVAASVCGICISLALLIGKSTTNKRVRWNGHRFIATKIHRNPNHRAAALPQAKPDRAPPPPTPRGSANRWAGLVILSFFIASYLSVFL